MLGDQFNFTHKAKMSPDCVVWSFTVNLVFYIKFNLKRDMELIWSYKICHKPNSVK